MTVESPGWANQNAGYGAEQTRRAVFFAMRRDAAGDYASIAGGIRGPADMQLTAPGSGMSINVTFGECIVPGSSSATQGGYYGAVTATTNLPVAASNATNPRVDGVFATITDSGYIGSTDTFIVQVVTGTPTSGATLTNLTGAPSAPQSSLLLGYILVPATSTSVTSGNVSNRSAMVTPQLGQVGKTVFGQITGNYGTSSVTAAAVDGTNLSITLPIVSGFPVEIGFDYHYASGNSSTLPAGYIGFNMDGTSLTGSEGWAHPPSTVSGTATFQANSIVTRFLSIGTGTHTFQPIFWSASASWGFYIGANGSTPTATFWVRQLFEAV